LTVFKRNIRFALIATTTNKPTKSFCFTFAIQNLNSFNFNFEEQFNGSFDLRLG